METGIRVTILQQLREMKQSVYGRTEWTQLKVAERLDVSLRTYGLWERGEVPPDTKNLVKLSRLFGVSTDYLLGESKNETIINDTGLSEESLQVLRYLNAPANTDNTTNINKGTISFLNRVLEACFYRLGESSDNDKKPIETVFQAMEEYVNLDSSLGLASVNYGQTSVVDTKESLLESAIFFRIKKVLDVIRESVKKEVSDNG